MKTLLPALIFLFISFFTFHSAYSQTPIEYIISEYPHAKINKVIHVDGKTFVGGSIEFCTRAFVFSFDENGEKEWEFFDDGCSIITDMYFRTSDSILIVVNTWRPSCNVITVQDGPHVHGLDMNGTPQFKMILSEVDFDGSNFHPSIALNANEDIIISNGDIIFWLDDSGNFLSSKNHPSYMMDNVIHYDDTTMMVTNEINLIIMDETGEIKNEINLNHPILDIQLDDDNLILLTKDLFYIYNILTESLSPIDVYFLDAEGMSQDENWLYIWGESQNTNDILIQQYDKNNGYTYMQSIPFEQEAISLTDIFSDNVQLYIVGKQDVSGGVNIYNGAVYQSFVKTTPIFSTPVFSGTDISISNFQVIQPSEIDYFDSLEFIYYFTNPAMTFEYDVTNEGTDTVFSFSTTSQEAGGYFCIIFSEFEHYQNIEILPGETITIQGATSSDWFHFQDEIRLSVFAPNHRFDRNPIDNSLSISNENFTTTTVCACGGLEFDLNIFPNPASDFLNISFNSTDFSNQEKFRIVNVEGKVLEEVKLIFGKTNYDINLKNYANGIYFFQYLKNNQVAKAEKVVVQH